MTTDWLAWHRDYEDPSSQLSRRLVVVRRRVGESLDALGADARRVLSLCAGTGGDLLPELAARPRLSPETLLVEANAELVDAARAAAASAALDHVRVRCADAGRLASFADVLPVDLLLLCGIFGNLSGRDIQRTVSAAPGMLRRGALVVWTRGRFEGEDLRPTVRRWFVDTGFDEVAYDGEPESYGVGVARWAGPGPGGREVPERLFTFVR
ncbi:MAG: hypothetical protein M5U27_04810 [Gaiella sp.]|nr:hypothetical protein [Gaiella sp.]